LKMIRDKSISSGYFEQITINRYEFYIAICQMRLGDLDGARIKLEELARDELNLAGNPETLFLGLIYFKANDFQKAKEWLTQADKSDGYLKNGVPIAQVANRYLEKIGNSM
jgi:tetratricopeptide (TPR) repeat protein